MKADYAPLNARARGLAQHLCSRAELERWADLPAPAALAQALLAGGRLTAPLPPRPAAPEIDDAVRHGAAAHLAKLEPWAGNGNPLLEAFHAEQERRSLRALLRGAVEGAAAERRLATLLPTPRLPAPVLADLARAASPREVATRLLVYGDPHAQVLLELTTPAGADLLAMERALARRLALCWQSAAAAGDSALRESLRERIDRVNAQAALELAGKADEGALAGCFIAGGQALGREVFVAAASRASRVEAAAEIVKRAAALAPLLRSAQNDPAALEAVALAQSITALRRRGRIEPLSSAPAQLFLAMLEAQSRDLRRIAWGLQLRLPAASLREGLLTPWN